AFKSLRGQSVRAGATVLWQLPNGAGRHGSFKTPGRGGGNGNCSPTSPESAIPAVELGEANEPVRVRGKQKPPLPPAKFSIIRALLDAWPGGLTKDELEEKSGYTNARTVLTDLIKSDTDWALAIERLGHGGSGRCRIL